VVAVARVASMTCVVSVTFAVAFVFGVAFLVCVFAFGVVVHVVGVVAVRRVVVVAFVFAFGMVVRLSWFAVVLVPLVPGVVVVLVVRSGIVVGVVAVRSVSEVVHVFPLDDESDIRIMVEAPVGGTRFAAIGPHRRVPVQ
jgi:hypothetical protein